MSTETHLEWHTRTGHPIHGTFLCQVCNRTRECAHDGMNYTDPTGQLRCGNCDERVEYDPWNGRNE